MVYTSLWSNIAPDNLFGLELAARIRHHVEHSQCSAYFEGLYHSEQGVALLFVNLIQLQDDVISLEEAFQNLRLLALELNLVEGLTRHDDELLTDDLEILKWQYYTGLHLQEPAESV